MGVEKGKKLPTRLNKHNKNRLDKHSNKVKKGGPKGGEGKKRKEKEPNSRKKLEKEDDMFDHEQDTNGFFKVPKDVKLDDDDERILTMMGSLNINSNQKKGGKAGNYDSTMSTMIEQLDKSIQENTLQKNEIDLMNDPKRNEKITIVYKDIADILSKYRYGKLPKAFHIVPSTYNTFQLLDITEPTKWTPHAYYEVTKEFSVTMSADKFRHFLGTYLLPAVRKDIKENKKLNYHYYSALRRGLFKPASWFRGILFPFCEDQDVTIKEAEIIASIVIKKSIPSIHSAICILKLTQMPYTGAVNIILFSLLRKQYALPKSVISSVYDWIDKFTQIKDKLPVIWYQTVLSVCQTYGKHFTNDQKVSIKEMVKKVHKHAKISPEIVKSLLNRGDSLNVTMIDDSRMIY